jgi:hypothetical protein
VTIRRRRMRKAGFDRARVLTAVLSTRICYPCSSVTPQEKTATPHSLAQAQNISANRINRHAALARNHRHLRRRGYPARRLELHSPFLEGDNYPCMEVISCRSAARQSVAHINISTDRIHTTIRSRAEGISLRAPRCRRSETGIYIAGSASGRHCLKRRNHFRTPQPTRRFEPVRLPDG